jgi:peptidoglycan/xylan/chitin deacetylase (PgdA/CDA1 family)
MNLKLMTQTVIRESHRLAATRPLPDQVGIYFHALEERQHSMFAECVEFWKELGYGLANAQEFVRGCDEKSLYISFDDNHKQWHSALPLFDDLDVKVTFFINSLPIRGRASAGEIEGYFDRIGYHGDRVTLSVEEIQEIAAAGHTIACHSHSHFDLGSLPAPDAHSEILRSKEILEDIVQTPVQDFSYPFGMRRNFTDALRDFCLANGFATVSNAIPGCLYQLPTAGSINRTPWDFGRTLDYNVANMRIDGRLFERLTGRSAVV